MVTYQDLHFLFMLLRFSSCELDFELSDFGPILQIQLEARVPLLYEALYLLSYLLSSRPRLSQRLVAIPLAQVMLDCLQFS